jgi:TolA-binding protein
MVGDTVAAIDTLKGALERYPAGKIVPVALLELGSIYQSLNDAESAGIYLNRLLAEHGDSIEAASAAIRLAEIHRNAGAIDTAKGLLYHVTGRFPNSRQAAQAWVVLAETEKSPERSDSVRRELLRVAERDDTLGVRALFTAASLYRSEGNHQDAARMLEELVSRFGGDENLKSRARIALGEAYERLGFIQKARESYEEILRRYCDERYKKQAQEHLQALGKL